MQRPGAVFLLHFPVSFQLHHQFRGGPWATPLHKVSAARQAATQLLRLQDTGWPCPSRPLTMGGPHHGVCLALCLLLMLSGAMSQKASCASWCPPNSTCDSATTCRCNPGFSSLSGEIINSPVEFCDDINECAPPTSVSCGKFADCQNVDGSYYCMCSPGYQLASGGRMFRNKSENTCQDVDECQQKPRSCRSPGICVNTQGSFTCQCPLGFQLKPEDPKQCTDVNECSLKQKPCHNTTHCLNTIGGYRCSCRPGWKPVPGSPNGPNDTVCEDVNECLEQNPCHDTTRCINTVGSYRCRCRPGWKPVPGSPNNSNNTMCEDVDECLEQNPCHNTTCCLNTVGSYRCYSKHGWKPISGSPSGPNHTVCKEMPFPSWTLPSEVSSSQHLSRFFKNVQDLGRNYKPQLANDTILKLIEYLDELLEAPWDLANLSQSTRYRIITRLLLDLEEALRTLAQGLPGPSYTYHSPSDTELSLMIREPDEDGDGIAIVGRSHARMKLSWAMAAAGPNNSGRTVMGILSSPNLRRLLDNTSLDLESSKKEKLEEIYEIPVRGAQLRVLSAINTVFLSNKDTKKLNSSVTFAFSHLPKIPGPRQELICAFWKGEQWSTTGCRMLGGRTNSTTCQCDHLSSFAILMAHYDVEDPTLATITKVGLAVSLVCLLLCILTFLLVRPIQNSRTTVHLHLCICLFVGSAIFLAGIENQGGEVGLRCRLVAGLLHYFFLAAFCWMGLEGLELYFLVVRVFQGQGLRTRWLCLIGYGTPGVIVGISAAVNSRGYGRDLYCWLDREGGFIWSFLGPVTFIILCNAVIFVITVWRLSQKFSEINPDLNNLKKARVITITAVAQLFVLGSTWVVGLCLFNPQSWVLAYIFSILNCLQGFFLFLLYCVLNKKVREEYSKWACLVTRNKYSEFTSSMSATSHQTRSLRPSESGM